MLSSDGGHGVARVAGHAPDAAIAPWASGIAAICLCALLCALSASAPLLHIDPPLADQFMADFAGMVDAEAEGRIDALGAELLARAGVRLTVLTIAAKAPYGGERMAFESFAATLYEQWRREAGRTGARGWDAGILLLVSRREKRAWIELGGWWSSEQETRALAILEREIVPLFAQERFVEGIEAGVLALRQLVVTSLLQAAAVPAEAPQPAEDSELRAGGEADELDGGVSRESWLWVFQWWWQQLVATWQELAYMPLAGVILTLVWMAGLGLFALFILFMMAAVAACLVCGATLWVVRILGTAPAPVDPFASLPAGDLDIDLRQRHYDPGGTGGVGRRKRRLPRPAPARASSSDVDVSDLDFGRSADSGAVEKPGGILGGW